MILAIFHMLSDDDEYRDLGADPTPEHAASQRSSTPSSTKSPSPPPSPA